MELKRLEVGSFENNCYILICPRTREAVVIDPAAEAEKILRSIQRTSVKYILMTHGHMDHIGALEEVQDLIHAPVGIHEQEARALRRKPDFFLQDGQILTFGDVSLKALHTPGHSPGAVCFLSGKILFSALVPSGFQETDHTPPAAVGGVNVTTQSFANLLQWTDVAGETGATYTGWVSEKPFSTVDDPGVENLPPFGLPAGTQLANHLLRAPITDQQVSLYYGVNATDKAGNTNAPTVIGPITNTAKGVPTISKTAPANFAADGDLSEWSSIPSFLLSVNPATPTCHVVTNSAIDGDADLKVTAYLATDATNLYIAFDVDDDVVSIDTAASASSWLQDCPDMFIGLFDWRGKHHSAYQHGTTPDYHLRFSQNKIIIDNDGGAVLMAPGVNYAFVIKQLTSGYTIEARIPWTQFHDVVPSDSVFAPVEGMRIPIDFEINDNDTPGSNTARQGMMAYSTLNNDNSYSDVWRWTYTWIGAKSSTLGVNDQPTVANVYELKQNYPNPFNPSTIINYSLAKSGQVTVKVFDVLGREVATLVNGEVQAAGSHQVSFSTSTLARGASSGVYFYRIESGSFRDVKKMMLIK